SSNGSAAKAGDAAANPAINAATTAPIRVNLDTLCMAIPRAKKVDGPCSQRSPARVIGAPSIRVSEVSDAPLDNQAVRAGLPQARGACARGRSRRGALRIPR